MPFSSLNSSKLPSNRRKPNFQLVGSRLRLAEVLPGDVTSSYCATSCGCERCSKRRDAPVKLASTHLVVTKPSTAFVATSFAWVNPPPGLPAAATGKLLPAASYSTTSDSSSALDLSFRTLVNTNWYVLGREVSASFTISPSWGSPAEAPGNSGTGPRLGPTAFDAPDGEDPSLGLS